MHLQRARALVRYYLDRHLYDTAAFWADKAVSISRGCAEDVFTLAQSLFLAGRYRRAALLLKSKGLVQCHLICRYLVAKCHAQCGEWKSVIDVLDILIDETDSEVTIKELSDVTNTCGIISSGVDSAICYLRGVACQALENRLYAKENYKQALRLDVFCSEAFDALMSHHLLTPQEAREFLDTLPFDSQCSDTEEQESLRFLYYSQLDVKVLAFDEASVPESLSRSLDVKVCTAEQYYISWDHDSAVNITKQILKEDLFHPRCVLLHIGCLAALEETNEIFLLAHKLVDDCPQEAISWYAVGCYYTSCQKYDTARQFFSKAMTIDPLFGESWLAFAHAFAYEGEHDQAIAAYQTAARHMPGCHLPLLFIGQEYVQMDNSLAGKFFKQALKIAPEDPDVLHELGVLKYQLGMYQKAEKYFSDAISHVEKYKGVGIQRHWEMLYNNYGHVCRKLGKYDDAILSHHKALQLELHNPSTHSALGFVYSLTLQHRKAVEEYHKALKLKKEDTFTMQLLNHELEVLAGFDPLQGTDLGANNPNTVEELETKIHSNTSDMDDCAKSETLSDIEID
ncbi:cell division cycle protein 16 homolog [Corticium candelabrum]|uniref:cell division cycle protein 16 homolog n=1 Tax=Corticium candelabrum TaxID=121492 RepID=UPI002E26EE6E|nr:cell division cycle protein 16 homolog [Corticium candelabrum]